MEKMPHKWLKWWDLFHVVGILNCIPSAELLSDTSIWLWFLLLHSNWNGLGSVYGTSASGFCFGWSLKTRPGWDTQRFLLELAVKFSRERCSQFTHNCPPGFTQAAFMGWDHLCHWMICSCILFLFQPIQALPETATFTASALLHTPEVRLPPRVYVVDIQVEDSFILLLVCRFNSFLMMGKVSTVFSFHQHLNCFDISILYF